MTIREINEFRIKGQDNISKSISQKMKNKPDGQSIRVAFLIDSLKHPEEHELLKLVYRNMFYQIGVLSSSEDQLQRMVRKYPKSKKSMITEAIECDRGQDDAFGQKMQETITLSDIFIRNNLKETNELKTKVKRYVGLLMGENEYYPSNGEWAMTLAASTAKNRCVYHVKLVRQLWIVKKT